MSSAPRRKHHKIENFAAEIVEAINDQLVAGRTYQEITDWINEQGYEITKSSVHRYGSDFLTRMERIRVVRDQAKAIIEEHQDRPATELAEAANLLGVQLIMEELLEREDLSGSKADKLLMALAQLERATVAREKVKLDWSNKTDSAMKKLKDQLRVELEGHPDLIERIQKLIDRAAEAITK